IKTMTGSPAAGTPGKRPVDIDLDMKLGAVVGYNGEAVRSLDLKMPRGAGGALFRFTDVYARMTGGQMVIAMDAPSADNPLQQGSITVRQFSVHDEAQLQHAVNTTDPQVQRNVMDSSSMRVDFDKSPGRVVLRDGVVRGPSLGATIDGMIDYSRDELHLRGTLVPLYGPNNLLGQLPIVGLFLGGEKEGLVGITYEVVGRPGNPVLRINPISALAPGLLRKVFEFPMNNGTYEENNNYNYNNNNNNSNYSAPPSYNSNYNNR